MTQAADIPIRFHELRDEDFPFTIRYISVETGNVLEETVVDSPGVLVIKAHREKVRVEIYWPDGEVDK